MLSNRNTGNGAESPAHLRRPARALQMAETGLRRLPPPAAHGRAACCRIAARLAASHYEVPLAEVAGRRRGSRRATRARHVAMYLAHVAYGLNLVAVGAGFGRDRTTAAYACGLIEDARDDPAFDAALAGLEISAGILLDLERGEKAA